MVTKKAVDANDLRDMANQLEHWGARYRELSEMLDLHSIASVKVTGMATFARILKHLGSNTRRIKVQIQRVIDDKESPGGVDDR